jgi:hypothetical protein
MLKFIKHHLSSIEGVDMFASVALVLFVAIFVYVTYYSFFSLRPEVADELSALPLNNDDTQSLTDK